MSTQPLRLGVPPACAGAASTAGAASATRAAGTGDVSRREFIGGAVVAGAGLLLGVALPGCQRGPKAVTASGGTLNAWLRIAADDSITVIVDRSEMGQGVYTALPMLLAEELEVGLEAITIEAAPVGDAYVNPLNGGQITGTSNSVTDAWDKLRTAGAQARTLLIAAAAQAWRVDPADCHAANGRVVNSQGASLSYGQLASAASLLPLPKTVVLKAPAAFSLLGRPVARIDTPSKVDGSAEFGIDVRLPGMLYAALLQSPVLGGAVTSVDSAAAEALPGVRKVLTVPGGVLVVADHYWQALKAREALVVTWEPGANAALDNAAITALLRTAAAAGPGLSARADGAAAAVIAAAQPPGGRTLHADYSLPLLAHATMEPMNCTADVRADGCDLYVGTQVQQMAQAAAATAAGLQASQVNVHTTLLGGGFGRRLEIDFIPAAVLASKAVAAPVKLIWTREDDMTHDYYRPPALEQMSAAFDGAKLSAFRLHVISPSITARFAPQGTDPFDSVVEYAVNFPYDVPNVSVEYSRREIGIDVGYMRSVSHAPNCFAIEGFMDELAAATRRNPFEFRRDLLPKPRHRRVLEAAAERAAWGRAPAGRHQGMAFMEGYTTVLTQVAEISVQGGELKVHRIVCVVDCGHMVNPRIVESQIVSGIIFGLSAALWGDITLAKGVVQQRNFDGYRVMRANEVPDIDVLLLDSDAPPGGIGEPSVALVAPALCNAIYAATGRRLRSLPIAGQLAAHHRSA
jgi:isoquinoline 1-oxidoreductase beta subunit